MNQENTLALRSPEQLMVIGEMFESSGMFGCSQKGQGTVLALTCVMTGMSPLEVNQTYHIIDGRLSMRADAMLAKFLERGGKMKIVSRTADRAAAVFIKGDNEMEAEYTMAEAQKSGICQGRDGKLKTNWAKFPKQMLWARLISDSVRALDPGVNMGTYTPEEVQDFDDKPGRVVTVTPMEQAPRANREKVIEAEVITPEKAKPEAAPVKVQPEVEPDFSAMPVGKYKGKKWSEFTPEQLEKVIRIDHPEILIGHKTAAKAELDRQNGAEGKEEAGPF